MEENWYALFLSIVKRISPDEAMGWMFSKRVRSFNKRQVRKKSTKRKVNPEAKYIEDPLKLIELKKNYTYKEIAKMYNTYPNKIYMDIRDYKKSLEEVI